jgi:hypothetical protein
MTHKKLGHAVRSQTRNRAGSSHLFLTINKSFYLVEPLVCEPGSTAERAFRLNKADGTLYDVAQTRYGAQCDCPDFIFRRDGLDPSGCKHVKALAGQGLIDAGAAVGAPPGPVRTNTGRR